MNEWLVIIRTRIWVLFLLFLAISFSILPIASPWHWFMPNCVALILIYFVMTEHGSFHFVGLGMAFGSGLILDGLQGGLLGQNAFVLTLMVFVASQFRYRFRHQTVYHQMMFVGFLIGCIQLVLLFLQWIKGSFSYTSYYWVTSLTSMLSWPMINVLLQRVCVKIA